MKSKHLPTFVLWINNSKSRQCMKLKRTTLRILYCRPLLYLSSTINASSSSEIDNTFSPFRLCSHDCTVNIELFLNLRKLSLFHPKLQSRAFKNLVVFHLSMGPDTSLRYEKKAKYPARFEPMISCFTMHVLTCCPTKVYYQFAYTFLRGQTICDLTLHGSHF